MSFKINKILMSAYTGLGNMILKTPMLRHISGLLPDVSVDLIAGNNFGAEHLFNKDKTIRKTHILWQNASAAAKYGFFRALRREQYDAVLLPFDAQPDFLLLGSYIAGIKRRIRHADVVKNRPIGRGRPLKGLPLPKTVTVPVPAGRHEIDLNYDLLEALYGASFERVYETAVGFAHHPEVLNRYQLRENGYILLQPGAANGMYKSKVWAPQNFVNLIKKLLENSQTPPIILVGDKGDFAPSIRPIVEALPTSKRLINTVGATSLNDLMNLIAGAQLVVCHDSGVMHLADALDKNLIALYGPTDHVRTRPLKTGSQLLFSKTPYFAVMHNFAVTEADLQAQGIGHEAMDGISVERLYQAIAARVF